jgi:hypothetical protein
MTEQVPIETTKVESLTDCPRPQRMAEQALASRRPRETMQPRMMALALTLRPRKTMQWRTAVEQALALRPREARQPRMSTGCSRPQKMVLQNLAPTL